MLNPFRTKTPNIYSQEEINLYCIIKLATEISLFSLQISKTWCFVSTDKIEYEHLAILSNLKSCQFAPRIVIFDLCICCQFDDFQIISPKIILWAIATFNCDKRSRAHFLAEIFLFLLVHNSEFLENLIKKLLNQTTFWCGLVLNG